MDNNENNNQNTNYMSIFDSNKVNMNNEPNSFDNNQFVEPVQESTPMPDINSIFQTNINNEPKPFNPLGDTQANIDNNQSIEQTKIIQNDVIEPSNKFEQKPMTLTEIMNQNSSKNTEYNEDEELLKIYIGNNYKDITTQKFNPYAFFLTGAYCFYRKMYAFGICITILNWILILLMGGNSVFVEIIIGAICGYLFNSLYVECSKNNIETLKKNTNEDIKELCRKKGGVSLTIVLVIMLFNLLIIFIAYKGMSKDIDHAKQSAAKSSSLSYIDNFELYNSMYESSKENPTFKNYQTSYPISLNGNVICIKEKGSYEWTSDSTLAPNSTTCDEYLRAVEKTMKGQSPDSARIILDSNGIVQTGTEVSYNGFTCTYDKNNLEEVKCE